MLAVGQCSFKDAVLTSYLCKKQLNQWRELVIAQGNSDLAMVNDNGSLLSDVQPRLFCWTQLAHQALLAKITLYFNSTLMQVSIRAPPNLLQAETDAKGSFQECTAHCNPDFAEM